MSRIRITCKAPAPAMQPAGYPKVNILSSFQDMHVVAVSDDGSEVELNGVTAVTFRCAQNDEPAKAVLEFIDVEVDVEADVDASPGAQSDVEPKVEVTP